MNIKITGKDILKGAGIATLAGLTYAACETNGPKYLDNAEIRNEIILPEDFNGNLKPYLSKMDKGDILELPDGNKLRVSRENESIFIPDMGTDSDNVQWIDAYNPCGNMIDLNRSPASSAYSANLTRTKYITPEEIFSYHK
ncbi:MAG: hypothetical protein JW789_04655 [Candidatus Aenigmarchaeota archaeon]|nr:hypothetical protein [Candidatus Aenigmarchaeota archaeon]